MPLSQSHVKHANLTVSKNVIKFNKNSDSNKGKVAKNLPEKT